MRIFVTGGSGCIGHYLVEELIEKTQHQLFLLVRNPDKLKINCQTRPNIEILQGDLLEIEKYSELLKTIDVAILVATIWGGKDITFEVNVNKTIALVNLLNPQKCQQVIYFSTASILNQNNQLMPEARDIGTDYIQSKYQCFTQLSQLKIAPKITTVFPTLILGGDNNKPYSHLSSGLKDVPKWINIARWFKADGSFHFIHGKDVAQIIRYLVDNPPQTRQLVLGNPAITANELVEQVANYFDKKVYFRIPLWIWLANIIFKIFNVQMEEWDRFGLNYRHFIYKNVVNPSSFGLTPYCHNIKDVFQKAGISNQ